MHLRFVGCGDAFGSGGRFNTCFHVVGATCNFLVDCGASSLVALKRLGVRPNAIDAILVTHFHADHFGGIPFFMLDAHLIAKRARPLVIAGPPGLEARHARAMDTAFPGSAGTKPRFALELKELRAREPTEIGPLRVTPFAVKHGDAGGPCFAYRIEAEGRTIAYSGDTEWTDELIEAGREADLFVAEAYVREKRVKLHLDLASLESRLDAIRPKRLVLTHMSDEMLARRGEVAFEAAHDGMVVTL